METPKIANLLNDSSNYPSMFGAEKYDVIASEAKGKSKKENWIQFITDSVKYF